MSTTASPVGKLSVEKTPIFGMGLEYSIRLAPWNIARIRLERLSAVRFYVHWVYVPPAYRSAGIGGILLARVLKDADREGITLCLEARACGEISQAALESWYRAHGFRDARGPVHHGGRAMSRSPIRSASRRLRVAS